MINAEAVYGTNRLPEGKCFLCTLDTINYNIIQSKLCHLFFLKSKQFDLWQSDLSYDTAQQGSHCNCNAYLAKKRSRFLHNKSILVFPVNSQQQPLNVRYCKGAAQRSHLPPIKLSAHCSPVESKHIMRNIKRKALLLLRAPLVDWPSTRPTYRLGSQVAGEHIISAVPRVTHDPPSVG